MSSIKAVRARSRHRREAGARTESLLEVVAAVAAVTEVEKEVARGWWW